MGPLKALGLDRILVIFYQKLWDIASNDLTKIVQSAFREGQVQEEINKTYIALIPKKEIAESLADYRPISLWNVTYKLITKIIAKRIKPYLDRLISPDQGAFVLGRQITDNITIAQEILHSIKSIRGRFGGFALKLDMAKAYHRLEWEFISMVTKTFGFHNNIHNLIMSSIQRYKILHYHQWEPRRKYLFFTWYQSKAAHSLHIFLLYMPKHAHVLINKMVDLRDI